MYKASGAIAAAAILATIAATPPALAEQRPGIHAQTAGVELSAQRRYRRYGYRYYPRRYYGPRYYGYYGPRYYGYYGPGPYYGYPYYRRYYYAPGPYFGIGPFGFGFGW